MRRSLCRGPLGRSVSVAWILAAIACVATGAAARADELWPEPAEIDLLGDDEMTVVPPVDFDPDILLAQAKDPSITTVDEMDTRPSGGSSSGSGSAKGNAGQWWDSIRDPSIRTVDEQTNSKKKKEEKKKEWYERINIRGYTQFRINSVLWNDESQAPPYHPADRSIGPFNEFFIRRCRLIFSGDLSDRLYFYIQPDFAGGVPGARDGAINFTQLRDCYGDVYLTKNKVNRVRVGLSKVPFGWDNLQSSSNRLPLDRSDPINSAINGERGMGVF